jgi:hypothetical protein
MGEVVGDQGRRGACRGRALEERSAVNATFQQIIEMLVNGFHADRLLLF